MIEIENLRLRIGSKEILNGIDLHLGPGDIYGLLGPNGAGKSTTIFATLGLRAYHGGGIRVLGQAPGQGDVSIRRAVGVVPEKAGFYEWMTALEHLKWHGRLFSLERSDRDLMEMLEKVGLGDEGHHPVGTYSRGMRQRLAVARALITRPRLLILDEPANGLDPKGRREIHDLLVAFAAEEDRGVLLCTHLLDDVERLCNRIGIIANGATRLEGSLTDLMVEHKAIQRYRLRLQNTLTPDPLPDEVTVLGDEGGWLRVQVCVPPSEGPSALWRELWRRGWKIMEIHSEASNLEEIYMRHTRREDSGSQTQAVAA